jgi:hypothetical protein
VAPFSGCEENSNYVLLGKTERLIAVLLLEYGRNLHCCYDGIGGRGERNESRMEK